MVEFDFGKVENIIGFNKYIEEKLSEKQKIIDEQQATNDYLEEANSRLQIQLGETLRLVDEQQATIHKLQDLCGKSDGENAKLRNEIKLLKPTNIEQYEQIQKLQEENEQLQKIIDLTQYQLKVQDRILKEVGE